MHDIPRWSDAREALSTYSPAWRGWSSSTFQGGSSIALSSTSWPCLRVTDGQRRRQNSLGRWNSDRQCASVNKGTRGMYGTSYSYAHARTFSSAPFPNQNKGSDDLSAPPPSRTKTMMGREKRKRSWQQNSCKYDNSKFFPWSEATLATKQHINFDLKPTALPGTSDLPWMDLPLNLRT